MRAHVGDWLVIKKVNLDETPRIGLILQVPHPDGSPPYLVRWTDTDHESLMFPGPDAHLRRSAEHASF